MRRRYLGCCLICSKGTSTSYETVSVSLEELPGWLSKEWRKKEWTQESPHRYPARHVYLCAKCAASEKKLKSYYIKSISLHSDGSKAVWLGGD